MEAIGDLINQIVKKRNLGDQTEIQNEVLNSSEVKSFLKAHKDQIDMKMVKNSITNLFEFYNQVQNPDQVMKGYQPELFINGKVIDVRYRKTEEKIAEEKARAVRRNLRLIDLPISLHDVRLSEIEMDAGRKEVMSYVGKFLEAYTKNPHERGLYLSGDFGRGKTYILAGLANQVADDGKSVVFLHVPTFIANLSSHFGDNSLPSELRRISKCDLLILDDIGAETFSAWSRDDVLGVILQARMDNVLPTFFSSNLDMDDLGKHFEDTKDSLDKVKAARIMERIRFLAKEVVVSGPDRRKK